MRCLILCIHASLPSGEKINSNNGGFSGLGDDNDDCKISLSKAVESKRAGTAVFTIGKQSKKVPARNFAHLP